MKKIITALLAVAMMASSAIGFSAAGSYQPSVDKTDALYILDDNDNVGDTGFDWTAAGVPSPYNALTQGTVYVGEDRTLVFEFSNTMTAAGYTSFGFPAENATSIPTGTYDAISAGITGQNTAPVSFIVVQTAGQGVADISGSYDKTTGRLTLKMSTNRFASYVDVREAAFNIVAVYASTTPSANGLASFQVAASYRVGVVPNQFEAPTGSNTEGNVFAGGTTFTQEQARAFSELFKGSSVTFKVMDMGIHQNGVLSPNAVPNSIAVTFPKFALTEAVNFVYKSSYRDADFNNVLAVIDFQAAGRILNDVGEVTIGNVGNLGGFNFTGYNSTDKFNVYFNGKLIEEGVSIVYDAKTGASSLTFGLYNPTSTSSMLGKYVIAKSAVVIPEGEDNVANPEMGAADGMIRTAIALAAVSLAAAGFVAVKKSK